MPTVSAYGVTTSRKQGELEKSRKMTHREAISRANLALVKLSIDRSATFRHNQVVQDQKAIYRRFQAKLITTQLNHARLSGDSKKVREMKIKLRNLRVIQDDDEYDFFHRLSNETQRERSAQLTGRPLSVTQEDQQADQTRHRQDDDENNYESSGEEGDTTEDEDADLPSRVASRTGIIVTSSSGASPTPTSPSGGSIFTPNTIISRPSALRSTPQSRGLNDTPETEISEIVPMRRATPKATPRIVTFSPSAAAIRPETTRDETIPELPSSAARSKSLPELIAKSNKQEGTAAKQATLTNQPPEYEAVDKQSPSRMSSSKAPQIKSPTGGSPRSLSRQTTASQIFMKKEGPTKLERHEDWMRRRNYKGIVRNFCDSLLPRHHEPSSESATPTPTPTPSQQERPWNRRRGTPQPIVVQTFAPVAEPTPPPSQQQRLQPPVSIFDYSELFLQDTIVKRKTPIIQLSVDPNELRREGGNPNVRNLTMMRVNYH